MKIIVTDRYNKAKYYEISYAGNHYIVQEFVSGRSVTNKTRMTLKQIEKLTGLPSSYIKSKQNNK